MKLVSLSKIAAAILLLFWVGFVKAQPGCPSVNAGPDIALPCGTNCTNLTATFFQTGNTSTYGVSSIPYTPFSYTAGTATLVNIDDTWSDTVDLPFNFCFFGTSYNHLVIGSNGIITFDLSEANGYCAWDITASGTVPTTNIYRNCIMGPYHDIDPSLGGDIYYQISGTAPCRTFVVSFNRVPMYNSNNFLSNCFNTTDATHQIVLYETTNVIEIYIKDKDRCTGWNDGLAIEGIQNFAQTVAYTVPGRNNTVWTATNDAWRFTPNGPSIVSVDWLQNGAVIASGPTLSVCPASNTTYTAQATYTPCAGGTPVVETDNVTVTVAGVLQAGIDSAHNVTCTGANNGAAWAHASSSNSGLQYGWSDGAATLNRTNLAPGTYVFTATDASACVRRDTIVITEPTPVTANVPNVSQTTCSGTGTGILLAGRGGGTGPYTFIWNSSPVQNDSVLDGVAPATYTVTVTDSHGCTGSASGTLTITQGANNVAFTAPTITNITCSGTQGSITVSAIGGSGTFTYTWNTTPQQTGATISNLAAGQYCVTADDGTGCTATACHNITQPPAVVINPPAITNPICNGTSDGSITASASAGTPNYTYNWTRLSNNQALSGITISNLAADTYTLTVTDAVGCTATDSYTLIDASPVVISPPVIINPQCAGNTNGSITASATGGTGGYSYGWVEQTGGTPYAGQTINNLGAGTYNLTVTDVSGCTVSDSYVLTVPGAVTFNPPVIVNNDCNSNNSGSITADATGGTPGYTYNWVQQSNGTIYSGPMITNLSGDVYNVTATDVAGCTATDVYTVTSVTPLIITQSQTDLTCNGSGDGTATITVTSGTPAYSYNWNNTGASGNSTYTGLQAGVVNVVVNDVNCSATATFTILEPTAMQLSTLSLTNISCFGGNNGTVSVDASGGTPGNVTPYNYVWNTSPPQTTATATGLTATSVTVVATDANGCTTSQSFTLTEPAQLTAAADATGATCYQAPNGTISVDATGGTTPYTYQWDDSAAQTTKTAMGLVAGTYTAMVTDANGCNTTASDVVNEPADLLISTDVTAVKCIGDANGTISVAATGGTSPYNYSATQDMVNFVNATNDVIEGLAVGDYTVIVADNNGCTKTVLASVPNALPDNFTTSTDSTNCYGPDYNDGAVHVISTTLTNGPYQYVIDGGISQLSGDFYNVSAGAHTITAINNNGCVTTIPVVVLEPLPLVVDVVPDTVVLPLGDVQQVHVTYINANGEISYAWSPTLGLSCADCPDPLVSPFTSQDYEITLSYVHGSATCYGSATLHAEVLDPMPVFVPNSFSPNGDGNNDVFTIYGQGIKTLDLKIFNRWGELVYKSNNQFDGWDGTYKGQMQLPSVFTYTARVTYLDDKRAEKQGTVTLLR
jgi:gliding motility-associated-like protein